MPTQAFTGSPASVVETPSYTLSPVSEALGVDSGLFKVWLQRGIIPEPASFRPESGWRRFTPSEVVGAAAVNALAQHVSVGDASAILKRIWEKQSDYWRLAVEKCPERIMIFTQDGGKNPFCYAGDSLGSIGELLNPGVGAYVALYFVGPSIAKVLSKLTGKGEQQ